MMEDEPKSLSWWAKSSRLRTVVLMVLVLCAAWVPLSFAVLIWPDEAVWQKGKIVYCKFNEVDTKVSVYCTGEGHFLFDYPDRYQQFVVDTEYEKYGVVTKMVKFVRRFGRDIAQGLPLLYWRPDNAKVDLDAKAEIKWLEDSDILVKHEVSEGEVVEVRFTPRFHPH